MRSSTIIGGWSGGGGEGISSSSTTTCRHHRRHTTTSRILFIIFLLSSLTNRSKNVVQCFAILDDRGIVRRQNNNNNNNINIITTKKNKNSINSRHNTNRHLEPGGGGGGIIMSSRTSTSKSTTTQLEQSTNNDNDNDGSSSSSSSSIEARGGGSGGSDGDGSNNNEKKKKNNKEEDDNNNNQAVVVGTWPCMDKLDKDLIRISLPVIGNNAISPLIGAVDLFWVNRMGNALAVAGQAAANQVFNSVFWFTSFLPSVTATLVSKQHACGDVKGTQDAVCQALFVGFFIALIGTPMIFFNPDGALSAVLSDGAPAMQYAKPYLLIRSLAFLPSLISLVGFSAFRGIMDTRTPVKISAFANVFNAILDPILIFSLAMGVPGAAIATLAAEIISAIVYMILLRQKDLVRWRHIIKIPKWSSLEPLIKGGAALQLRNLSLNITFLAVARVTQAIDKTGVAAAAHAMAVQTFQVGGIVLLGLSTVAQTVVPNAMVKRYDEEEQREIGGLNYAKTTVNRLMSWGFLLGIILGSVQILLLPAIRKATPLQEVRDAATAPALIASVLQIINGLVFIGEGVMIGTGSFLQLSLSTVVATTGCLWALRVFPPKIGLSGVWLGFGVFNLLRLAGVWIHQTKIGPLSRRNIEKAALA